MSYQVKVTKPDSTPPKKVSIQQGQDIKSQDNSFLYDSADEMQSQQHLDNLQLQEDFASQYSRVYSTLQIQDFNSDFSDCSPIKTRSVCKARRSEAINRRFSLKEVESQKRQSLFLQVKESLENRRSRILTELSNSDISEENSQKEEKLMSQNITSIQNQFEINSISDNDQSFDVTFDISNEVSHILPKEESRAQSKRVSYDYQNLEKLENVKMKVYLEKYYKSFIQDTMNIIELVLSFIAFLIFWKTNWHIYCLFIIAIWINVYIKYFFNLTLFSYFFQINSYIFKKFITLSEGRTLFPRLSETDNRQNVQNVVQITNSILLTILYCFSCYTEFFLKLKGIQWIFISIIIAQVFILTIREFQFISQIHYLRLIDPQFLSQKNTIFYLISFLLAYNGLLFGHICLFFNIKQIILQITIFLICMLAAQYARKIPEQLENKRKSEESPQPQKAYEKVQYQKIWFEIFLSSSISIHAFLSQGLMDTKFILNQLLIFLNMFNALYFLITYDKCQIITSLFSQQLESLKTNQQSEFQLKLEKNKQIIESLQNLDLSRALDQLEEQKPNQVFKKKDVIVSLLQKIKNQQQNLSQEQQLNYDIVINYIKDIENIKNIQNMEKNLHQKRKSTIQEELEALNHFEFDAFKIESENLKSLTNTVIFHLFKQKNLLDTLQIDQQKLKNLVNLVCQTYLDSGLFQECRLTIDRIQKLNFFLNKLKLQKKCQFNEIKLCSLYISALILNFRHSGYDNEFLKKISHDISITYNDKLSNQNNILSQFFDLILNDEKYKICEKFSQGEYTLFRSMCIQLVSESDYSTLEGNLSKFEQKIPNIDLEEDSDKIIMASLIFYCSQYAYQLTQDSIFKKYEKVLQDRQYIQNYFYDQMELKQENQEKIPKQTRLFNCLMKFEPNFSSFYSQQ